MRTCDIPATGMGAPLRKVTAKARDLKRIRKIKMRARGPQPHRTTVIWPNISAHHPDRKELRKAALRPGPGLIKLHVLATEQRIIETEKRLGAGNAAWGIPLSRRGSY